MNNQFFFIIGAQRSGTTYLHNILEEHPEISMASPVIPEPKFFLSSDYKKGKAFYINKFFPHSHPRNIIFGEKPY